LLLGARIYPVSFWKRLQAAGNGRAATASSER
jgi:hypothetical protein